MTRWRILADDLTGALDTAAAFEGPVTVWLDHPGIEPPPATDALHSVSVVATATRDIAPDGVGPALGPSLDWLAGADVAFKKVDSLLRGNTFEELRWLAETGRFRGLTLAPAFPAQGRFTVDGQLSVAGQAVEGPSLLERLANLPLPVAVPDVRDAPALRALAESSRGSDRGGHLWCGSAGLAHALSAAHDLAPSQAPAQIAPRRQGGPATPLAPHGGRRVLISASHHPVSRRQWACLTEQAVLNEACVVRGGQSEQLQQALTMARQSASIAAPCELWLDLSPQEPLTAAQAQALLAHQVRQIAAELPAPDVLLVIGGDTLRALCDATGVQHLNAYPSPWAGWGQSQWSGGRWAGTLCHSRSGAFGQDDDLLQRWRDTAAM